MLSDISFIKRGSIRFSFCKEWLAHGAPSAPIRIIQLVKYFVKLSVPLGIMWLKALFQQKKIYW